MTHTTPPHTTTGKETTTRTHTWTRGLRRWAAILAATATLASGLTAGTAFADDTTTGTDGTGTGTTQSQTTTNGSDGTSTTGNGFTVNPDGTTTPDKTGDGTGNTAGNGGDGKDTGDKTTTGNGGSDGTQTDDTSTPDDANADKANQQASQDDANAQDTAGQQSGDAKKDTDAQPTGSDKTDPIPQDTGTGAADTSAITLQPDGTKHDLAITGDGGSTLDGITVEARPIGITQTDGTLKAASDTATNAARQAGGQGANPVDDLFRRIIAGTAYTNKAAPILHDRLRDATPAGTRTGDGSMSLDDGWYLATVKGDADPSHARLAYVGPNSMDKESMMTSALVRLQGGKGGLSDDTIRSSGGTATSLLDGIKSKAMSLFGVTRDAPPANSVTYGAISNYFQGPLKDHYQYAYNYDFTWNTTAHGSIAAFCVNPGGTQADRNSIYSETKLIYPLGDVKGDKLRTVLWYGYRGYSSIYDRNNEGTWGKWADGTGEQQAWATHLLLSAIFEGRDVRHPGWSGSYYINGQNVGWYISDSDVTSLPGYMDLVDLMEHHPLSHAVNFYAWRIVPDKGSLLGEGGWNGVVKTEDDQWNKAQPMVSGVLKPTRIEADTIIRNRNTFQGDNGRTQPLGDDISITPKATEGNDSEAGWPAGEQLLVCSQLNFNNNADNMRNYNAFSEKCVIANPARDVPGGTPYRLPDDQARKLWFHPSDLGWDDGTWKAGHYWFNVYFDAHHNQGNENAQHKSDASLRKYAHVFNFDNWTYEGANSKEHTNATVYDPDENMELYDYHTTKQGDGLNPANPTAAVRDDVEAFGGTPNLAARVWLYVDTNGDGYKNLVCGDNKGAGYDGFNADNDGGTRWTPIAWRKGTGTQLGHAYATTPDFLPGQCVTMDGEDPEVDQNGAYAPTGDNTGKHGRLTTWPAGHYWWTIKFADAGGGNGGDYWHHGADTALWGQTEQWEYHPVPEKLEVPWAPPVSKDYEQGASTTPVTDFKVSWYDADANGKPTGQPKQTVSFGENATATFQAKVYTDADLNGKDSRTFTYVFREERPAGDRKDGVAYDTADKVVHVTISKKTDADGKAYMDKTDDLNNKPVTFTNRYTPNPVTVGPAATKTFTGDELAKANITDFQFDLLEGEGTGGRVLQTKRVDAKTVTKTGNDTTGTITFDPFTWCATNDTTTKNCANGDGTGRKAPVGDWKYTVREQTGTAGGVTYDTKTWTYTVTVKDDGKGHLTADLNPKDPFKGMRFTNAYKAKETAKDVDATKAYTQGGQPMTVKAGQFTFDLKDDTGKVVATATTAEGGKVTFHGGTGDGQVKALHFTSDDDMKGQASITRKFTIVERKGMDPFITYDTAPRPVTVTVEDNGTGQLVANVSYDGEQDKAKAPTITNTRTPKVMLPVTGGMDPLVLAATAGTVLALLLAAGTIILMRRRKATTHVGRHA